MEDKNPSIHNVHVDVHEEDEHVTFLYRVVDGKADKSYGINVARLAHLPSSVLDRAKQILDNLETQPNTLKDLKEPVVIEKENPKHVETIAKISSVDVNKMTPMEAMQFLYELKNQLN